MTKRNMTNAEEKKYDINVKQAFIIYGETNVINGLDTNIKSSSM